MELATCAKRGPRKQDSTLTLKPDIEPAVREGNKKRQVSPGFLWIFKASIGVGVRLNEQCLLAHKAR